ncbi:EamA family transporter, partial [Streptomyces anulatus]|uniref:EamA family transporter n=1 Tax=Streptomyces anulatus TaxID=1892 RepID=UPI00364D0E1E
RGGCVLLHTARRCRRGAGGSCRRPRGGGGGGAGRGPPPLVTVIGFVCWYSGMQRIGAERATLFSGLIPVSAALTAPLVGAGTYGPAQGVGSLLVGAGVAYGSGVFGRRGAGGGGLPVGGAGARRGGAGGGGGRVSGR